MQISPVVSLFTLCVYYCFCKPLDLLQFPETTASGQPISTTEHIEKPKCIVGEQIIERQQGTVKTDTRYKRFAINNSKWHTTKLKWKVSKYSSKLTNEEVDEIFGASFKIWEVDTNLQFEKVEQNEKSHIQIMFVTGPHGDMQKFDGPGNELAHAFFPEDGQIHIDDDEPWAPSTSYGRDLFPVAAHEIGHTLGLRHSVIRSALMYAEYKGKNEALNLDQDDIDAVQVLYGTMKTDKSLISNDVERTNDKLKKSMIPMMLRFPKLLLPNPQTKTLTSVTTTTPTLTTDGIATTTSTPIPPTTIEKLQNTKSSFKEDICEDSKIDVYLALNNGTEYVFKGNAYWRFKGANMIDTDNYPRNILDDWGIPGQLDAAYADEHGDIYFFKGEKYWQYSNSLGRITEGFPKLIAKDFIQTPNYLDGVINWQGKMYFFKGKRYWPYAEDNAVKDWPKYINEISPNLENKVNAAGTGSDGNSYLFSGHVYYKTEKVDGELKIAAGYPKQTAKQFFGCSS